MTHDETSLTEASGLSLLDLIAIIVKQWRMILLVTVITGVIVLALNIYAKYMPADAPFNFFPDYYAPEVKVRVQNPQSTTTTSDGGSESLTLLKSLAGLDGGGASETNLAMELLKGNSLIDRVAEELDFNTLLGESPTPKTRNRNFFRSSLSVDKDTSTDIITIQFEHTDKQIATDILTETLSLLEERFRELTLESVTVKKKLIDSRLEQVIRERSDAEQALIDYQAKWGILDIESQAEAEAADVTQLKTSILNLQFEIGTLERVRRDDDPELRRKKIELSNLEDQLDYRQMGGFETDVVYIPSNRFPAVAAEFNRLKEEVLIQQTLYSTLRQQYELVRIEEADTARTFQVIESAEVPEQTAGPSRARLVVVVTFAGFLFAILLAFVRDYLKRLRRDPDNAAKIEEISQSLPRFRARHSS